MWNLKRKEEKPSPIDPVIDSLCSEMESGWSKEEYSQQAADLRTLMEAKAMEPKRDKVSANTMAIVLGNLAGIILIVIAERTGVITSKGMNFVLKPKT